MLLNACSERRASVSSLQMISRVRIPRLLLLECVSSYCSPHSMVSATAKLFHLPTQPNTTSGHRSRTLYPIRYPHYLATPPCACGPLCRIALETKRGKPPPRHRNSYSLHSSRISRLHHHLGHHHPLLGHCSFVSFSSTIVYLFIKLIA